MVTRYEVSTVDRMLSEFGDRATAVGAARKYHEKSGKYVSVWCRHGSDYELVWASNQDK